MQPPHKFWLSSGLKLTAWRFVSARKSAQIVLTRLDQGNQTLQQAPQPWRLLWAACSDESQHGDAGIYLLQGQQAVTQHLQGQGAGGEGGRGEQSHVGRGSS
jgi:hypothetical protein